MLSRDFWRDLLAASERPYYRRLAEGPSLTDGELMRLHAFLQSLHERGVPAELFDRREAKRLRWLRWAIQRGIVNEVNT